MLVCVKTTNIHADTILIQRVAKLLAQYLIYRIVHGGFRKKNHWIDLEPEKMFYFKNSSFYR